RPLSTSRVRATQTTPPAASPPVPAKKEGGVTNRSSCLSKTETTKDKTSTPAATPSIVNTDGVPSHAKLLSNWRCPMLATPLTMSIGKNTRKPVAAATMPRTIDNAKSGIVAPLLALKRLLCGTQPKRRRISVSTTERTIDVTIGKQTRTFPLRLSYLMSPGRNESALSASRASGFDRSQYRADVLQRLQQ